MEKEPLYKAFKIQKNESPRDAIGKFYLTIMIATQEGRWSDATKIELQWQNERDRIEYGWYGMSMKIEAENNYKFPKIMSAFIAPFIKKMDTADLMSSSVKPEEICKFLEGQKISQAIYIQGEWFILKDIRIGNLFGVKKIGSPYSPNIILADSELDAKYKLGEKVGFGFNINEYNSKGFERGEYDDFFKQSWRSQLNYQAPKKEAE